MSIAAVLCSAVLAQAGPQTGSIQSIERSVQLERLGGGYSQAKLKEGVQDEQGMRTLKRSRALVRFLDSSELRINERTQLVIQTGAELRRMRLGSGAIWVKVPTGRGTVVETPTVTASVRGTQFELTAEGELRVYEGKVLASLPNAPEGQGVEVGAFQMAVVRDGKIEGPKAIPDAQRPRSFGGPILRWWEDLVPGREDLTVSSSQDWQDLQDWQGGTTARMVDSSFGFQPDFDRRLRMDAPERAWPYLAGLGLAASSLSSRISGPALAGQAEAVAGGFFSASAEGRYSLGIGPSLISGLESLHLTEGVTWARPASLLSTRRTLGESTSVEAGRFRIGSSPVVSDLQGISLGAGRHTGARLTWREGNLDAEAGWSSDASRLDGMQSVWFGSAGAHVFGGRLAVLGQSSARTGAASGYGVAASLPPLGGHVAFFGEWSRADGKNRWTVGAALPGLYEATGVDVIAERQVSETMSSWTLTARQKLSAGFAWTSQWAWAEGRSRWTVSAALRF